MPNGAEIIERAVNEFQRVQAHMKNAKRENAVETYAELKKDYKSLKVVLNSLGVNLTANDEIKELKGNRRLNSYTVKDIQ